MLQRIHYAEFFYPGAIVEEHSAVIVPYRDVKAALGKAGSYSFGFRFFDRLVDIVEGEGDNGEAVELRSKELAYTGMHYIDGELFNGQAIQAMNHDGSLDILLSNMDANGWTNMVRTRHGGWQPFEAEDKIVRSTK